MAMPYIAAAVKMIVIAKMVIIIDLYPRANLNMTLVAAPVLQASAISRLHRSAALVTIDQFASVVTMGYFLYK